MRFLEAEVEKPYYEVLRLGCSVMDYSFFKDFYKFVVWR